MMVCTGSAANTERSNEAYGPNHKRDEVVHDTGKDLPEGFWYRYSGKAKYFRLQTPAIPARTKVTIAVKLTQGEVKVFGGPDKEPREIFETKQSVYADTEKNSDSSQCPIRAEYILGSNASLKKQFGKSITRALVR